MARMDPHSYTDPGQGTVTRADLRLAVDFAGKRLHGEAILHLDGARGGVLDLDTRDLTIHAVRDAKGSELAYELGASNEVLGARLRVQLPAGSKSLTLAYETSPKASALQWLEPSNTAGKKHPYLFSQCQPHHARSMVPLQDSPKVRFAYHAEITVPDPLVPVMSAAPGARKPGPAAGTSVHTFEMPQPIPSYLLAIAVGNIAHRDLGPRSRVYTEPEVLEAAAWEFENVDAMLQKAEGLFGPYRWDRYDFLVMPPAFPYGGMENPRLTFLTPSLIAGDRSLVSVLAHELAHSWTGNLVTNATMNDFWLNEGFTVWAERRIHEAMEGKESLALAATIGREALQADIDRFKDTPQYTHLKNELDGIDPDEVYSSVPYEKGCLFVQLMENTAGRAAWDDFIQKYMDTFSFKSITTEDFLEFLDAQMPGLADKVGAMEWIYGPGVPANAPRFSSGRLQELQSMGRGWDDGVRPDPANLKSWPVDELLVYMGSLPKTMSQEDCAWLDDTFGWSESGNSEILCKWLVLAAASAYEPAYERVRSFLGSIGRMKYLKPLYKTMGEGESTKALAVDIFNQHKALYHPIARGGLEGILGLG